jgi:hypothetical protein
MLMCGTRLPVAAPQWEMIDQHEMMASKAKLPSVLKTFPVLAAFHERFKALPQLQVRIRPPAHLQCLMRLAVDRAC